ncbi:hypothetical protein DFH09DRAFT_1375984 [Mycena vulgaris]|nr:hypothetical protein DFH09DRAFT_1375984 [Mycena vulgaris]
MLALSSILALFALTALAVPVVAPAPDIGDVFAVYPGWDMNNGAPFGQVSGITEVAWLADEKIKAVGCVGYAYVTYGSPGALNTPRCVLKDAIDLKTFVIQSAFVTNVAIVGACGTFSPD